MTKQERRAFQEENRIGYLMIVLAFVTGIHMFNGWNQINPQVVTTDDAVVTDLVRPTENLTQ